MGTWGPWFPLYHNEGGLPASMVSWAPALSRSHPEEGKTKAIMAPVQRASCSWICSSVAQDRPSTSFGPVSPSVDWDESLSSNPDLC